MARAPAHITRRSGVYIYRRRVPDDVRQSAYFGGKQHFQESLRTGNLHEAKTKALSVGFAFDAEVANLRAGAVKAKPLVPGVQFVLTAAALDSIQAKWFAAGAARDREKRAMADRDPDGPWAHHMDGQDDDLHLLIAQLSDPAVGRSALLALKEKLKEDLAAFVSAEARRWGAAPLSEEHRQIESAVVSAEVDVLKASHAGWGGYQQEPTTQAVKRGLSRNLKPQSSWTMVQLANHVLKVAPKGASWEHKVLQQVLPLFDSHLTVSKALSDITSTDIRSFIEQLQQCPTNAVQRFPGRSLSDAIQLNRGRAKPHPTLTPNTIRDTHYAVLRSLFGYAVAQEWLVASPADRVKVAGTTKRSGRRPSFKMEELEKLFRLPVFTGCKTAKQFGIVGDVKLNDHRYWTPLLMLFSGIRPSEIGQLAVSDVKLTGRTPYISILTEFDPDDPDDKPFYVSFKTENARREVPIHPKLLDLGFGRYAQDMAAAGHVRLFPEWKQSGDDRKLYSGAAWIRRFNEVLIPACTDRHPKPTFYSLRHTFKVAMASEGIYPAIQNQILGHANVGMDAFYFDSVTLEDLHQKVSLVDYKHLDLGHLIGTRYDMTAAPMSVVTG